MAILSVAQVIFTSKKKNCVRGNEPCQFMCFLCHKSIRNIDFLLSIAMLGNTYVLVNLFNWI
jgi:hypothetical protein